MNNSRGRPQDIHSHSCQRRRQYYSSEKGNSQGRNNMGNGANWKIVTKLGYLTCLILD